MFQLIMAIFRLPSIIQGRSIFLMCVGMAVNGMEGIIICGGDKSLSLCEGTSGNIAVQVLIIMLLRNIYMMSASCVVTYWSLLSVLPCH